MLKKALAAASVLLLVLLVVLITRAQSMTSLQPAAVEAVEIAVDEEGSLERFAGAIRHQTISHEDAERTDSAAFFALHDYFEEVYPQVHEQLERELVGGLSLLYTWHGTEEDLDPVVLMGHQDVVPVIPGTENDWTHPPFGGVLADGYLWGRGTMDDKISVVAILEAVEALLTDGFQPRRTHYLAFGHDEEIGGSRGALAIAELLEERGAEPYAFVLDEGGAVARDMIPGIDGAVAIIGIAEKGSVNIELVVEGPGGHSSSPPTSTNIGILADAIDAVEAHPLPPSFEGAAGEMFRYLAPEMDLVPRLVLANMWLFEPVVTWALTRSPATASMVRTTTAVTIVEGGVKSNVLPISARALVNHRIRPGETPESVLEHVRSAVADDRVSVRMQGGRGPSPVSDPNGTSFRTIAHTIKQVIPDDNVLVAPYLVMGGTDAKHYSGRSDQVFRFVPAPAEGDALQRIHGTDERISPEGVFASIRFFKQLIRNSDGM